MSDSKASPDGKREGRSPGQMAQAGMGLIVGALVVLWIMSQWEYNWARSAVSGEAVVVHWSYPLGGASFLAAAKWLISGFLAVCGVASIVIGISKAVINSRRLAEQVPPIQLPPDVLRPSELAAESSEDSLEALICRTQAAWARGLLGSSFDGLALLARSEPRASFREKANLNNPQVRRVLEACHRKHAFEAHEYLITYWVSGWRWFVVTNDRLDASSTAKTDGSHFHFALADIQGYEVRTHRLLYQKILVTLRSGEVVKIPMRSVIPDAELMSALIRARDRTVNVG